MNKILAISINTFKEAVRNRVLYVLLFFAILIMFGAWIISTLSIDDETRIIRDLGVGAINFIAVLIAVFVGVGLVYNDLDKKTIYTIIPKPISRWQFLLGKYFGLLLTIAVNILFMTWIFASVLHFRSYMADDVISQALYNYSPGEAPEYKGAFFHLFYIVASAFKSLVLGIWHIVSFGLDGYQVTSGLFLSSILTVLEMSIITAFAVLFSSFSSPTLSAFLTVIIFVIGRLNQDLYLFAETMVQQQGGIENLAGGQLVAYYFAIGASHICPNLSLFDQRANISQFESIQIGFLDVGYALVYTLLIIVISMMVFNRRNFK